jgi:hypothetical protein
MFIYGLAGRSTPMSDLLYLDTARYGRICPRAFRAAEDLARLSAAEGCSPAFETLLRRGFLAWPLERRLRYQGLADWRGVGELKAAVKRFVRAGRLAEVHLANRSGFLLSLAARALFSRCDRVLTTDLDWPAYQDSLATAAARAGGELVTVPLRDAVFGDRAGPGEVAAAVRDAYVRQGCGGLFLSSVTNTGVRLPVREVIAGLHRAFAGPDFAVIDGTQALGLVEEDLREMGCDVYLAGFHKWMRAQSPLGVAVSATPRGYLDLEEARRVSSEAGEASDPLFAFARDLERKAPLERFGETVNVAPLFTARAALADPLANMTPVVEQNARLIREAAEGTGWIPVEPHTGLATGILLYSPAFTRRRTWSAETVRNKFHGAGIALTAYDERVVRMASPKLMQPSGAYEGLRRALANVAPELGALRPRAATPPDGRPGSAGPPAPRGRRAGARRQVAGAAGASLATAAATRSR